MPQDGQPDIEGIGHDTPLKAARRHCLSCCSGSVNEVRLCPNASCALWPYRFGKRPSAADRAVVGDRQVHPVERKMSATTGLRSIRKRCIDCSGANDADVRSCQHGPDHVAPCSLHAFRFGTNPFLAPRSDEWKQAAAVRLASRNRPAPPSEPSQRRGLEPAHDPAGVLPPKQLAAAE
jgi:hypothetical protein